LSRSGWSIPTIESGPAEADVETVSALAVVADAGHGPDPGSSARLVVTDAQDVVVGWVELGSGRRHVSDPRRSTEFHDAVDLWLELVDCSPSNGTPVGTAGAAGTATRGRGHLRLTETRFPDPPVRRTLVVPLRRR
jgi:hypothetical protein